MKTNKTNIPSRLANRKFEIDVKALIFGTVLMRFRTQAAIQNAMHILMAVVSGETVQKVSRYLFEK